MKDQYTRRSRPYPGRLPPVPDQPTQPVPQPSVAFEERSGAWAVLLGRECLAPGFPTLSAACDVNASTRIPSCSPGCRVALV
jgi:hypothetical protein